jgi:hypothetical protein
MNDRELKRKAERANNIWWRLSGLLGAERRVIMYAVIQAAFTVATMALTFVLFKSYHLHACFEVFKLMATVWNGGNYIFDVMPRQVANKKKKKLGGDNNIQGDMVTTAPNKIDVSEEHEVDEPNVCLSNDTSVVEQDQKQD